MPLKKILFIILCFFGTKISASVLSEEARVLVIQEKETGIEFSEIEFSEFKKGRPSPLLEKIKHRKTKGKKVTAALLAFPFPCGMVGLHRIYLGSAPYVPIVYIATLGGALGILPFIDFCVLLIDKELEPYINNDKVFMWVN